MLLEGGSSTNQAALPARRCKLCHSKGGCAHHQPLQQLLLPALGARGTWQWAPCASQCVQAAAMHRTAQQGSQAQQSSPTVTGTSFFPSGFPALCSVLLLVQLLQCLWNNIGRKGPLGIIQVLSESACLANPGKTIHGLHGGSW